METVRVENFPSDTNYRNFGYDMADKLPGVFEVDVQTQAYCLSLGDYEENRDTIMEFVRIAGAEVNI